MIMPKHFTVVLVALGCESRHIIRCTHLLMETSPLGDLHSLFKVSVLLHPLRFFIDNYDCSFGFVNSWGVSRIHVRTRHPF